MAGLAALMTRKKRDRRRELELRDKMQMEPAALAELTGKEAEEAMKAKAAHETIKKILIGKELLHQKSKASFDALSQISYQDDDESGKRGRRVADKEKASLMEKGSSKPPSIKKKKGGTGTGTSPKTETSTSPLPEESSERRETSKSKSKAKQSEKSPRVTLQSAKPARPRSTIPNYIEASSDEDDFNPEKAWNEPEPEVIVARRGKKTPPTPNNPSPVPVPPSKTKTSPTPPPLPSATEIPEDRSKSRQKKTDEILLNPKGLLL